MESKKGRLSRSEKMKLMINNYKIKLEEEIKEENKSKDNNETNYNSIQINTMNEKLNKYILEIKKKYKRKKKSKSQLLIEFEYKKLNELTNKFLFTRIDELQHILDRNKICNEVHLMIKKK